MVPYRDRYYWPHLNNTMLAFYTPLLNNTNLCVVHTHPGLSVAQKDKAQATIDLYKLDQTITIDGGSDTRHLERLTTISMAITRLEEYRNGKTTIQSILDLAISRGFFTLWLSIFDIDLKVKEALINEPEFKINKNAWFDIYLNPIPRNPGKRDPL